jgi:hypothetical protein
MERKGIKARCRYRTPMWAHSPHWQCASGVGLFQKVVTTDKRLRFRNQDRLR